MKKFTTRAMIATTVATMITVAPAQSTAQEVDPIMAMQQSVDQVITDTQYSINNAAQHIASQAQFALENTYNTIDQFVPDTTPLQQQLDYHYMNVYNSLGTVTNSFAQQDAQQGMLYTTQNVTHGLVQSVPMSEPVSSIAQTPQPTSIASTAHSMVGASGYDCSGFVQAAYAKQGINIPRTSYQQKGIGTPVSINNLQAGDIVFFYGDGHVGIYTGNGQIVHSPGAGHNVVYESLYNMPFSGATRVIY